MSSAIIVNKLNHAFDGNTVLNSVTFEVAAGRFFIIIGPNGSGKTTLLKLLTGLLQVQTGDIALMGRSLKEYRVRELARQIAYERDVGHVWVTEYAYLACQPGGLDAQLRYMREVEEFFRGYVAMWAWFQAFSYHTEKWAFPRECDTDLYDLPNRRLTQLGRAYKGLARQ